MKVLLMPERGSQIALRLLAQALEARGVRVKDVPVRSRNRVKIPAVGPGLRLAALRLAGYRVLHMHWIPFSDQRLLRLFLWMLRLLGIRLVWSIHNVLPHEPHAKDVEDLRLVFNAAHVRILHTAASRRRLEEEFGLSGSSFLIPLGNLNDAYPPQGDRDATRSRLGIAKDAFVLLLFGHLRPYKGLDTFVEVLDRLPPRFVGLVVGAPHDAVRPILAEAQERLAGRFILVADYVPDEKIADYFAASDAALYPFKAITGTHSVFLAYAYRKPALVRDLPGMDEIVRTGETGMLASTTQEFVDHVLALAADPAMTKRLGERGHDWAHEQFQWGRVAEGTQRAYEMSLEPRMPATDRARPPAK
jgi:glycosyltransferase involved in cell wall biosynthesis